MVGWVTVAFKSTSTCSIKITENHLSMPENTKNQEENIISSGIKGTVG